MRQIPRWFQILLAGVLASPTSLQFERLTPHLSARQRGENNRFDGLILVNNDQHDKAAAGERT
jgi:hypothetical protein